MIPLPLLLLAKNETIEKVPYYRNWNNNLSNILYTNIFSFIVFQSGKMMKILIIDFQMQILKSQHYVDLNRVLNLFINFCVLHHGKLFKTNNHDHDSPQVRSDNSHDIGLFAYDPQYGFFNSPTPCHINKGQKVTGLILIKLK
jgi:hypothetical protein